MTPQASDTRPFAGFEWMIAGRYLRARRKEGFISVIAGFSFVGIMLGVATLIIVMAVMNGFRAELLNKILGFTGHVNVYASGAAPVSNYDELSQTFLTVPGVRSAVPYVEGQVMVSSERQATGALVRGMREADLKNLPSVNNGKLRGTIEGFDNSTGVAIGYRMAWKHNIGLGQEITLIAPEGPDTPFGNAPRIRNFPIVALFEIGMSDYDENVIYMPLSVAQEYFLLDEAVTGIELRVEDPDDVNGYLEALNVISGPGYDFNTWIRRNEAFFSALAVERNVMFLILTLIILVAALNIISGLIMLVKDKGHDIAILRTMGATRGAIQRVFLITGASIGVVGTLAGLVLGIIVCLNIEHIRRFISWLTNTEVFSPELYYLSQLPAEMDARQTALIVLMALALSVVATLYPAWRAASLDPVEALRYE
jgi:lipoprotein-releasing system permease protein